MQAVAPFEIVHQADGSRTAANGAATITLQGSDGTLFRRRAVKGAGSPAARQVEWVVAELDGVRCYFDGRNAILTRADLMP